MGPRPVTTSIDSGARSAAALERIAVALEKIVARMPKPPPETVNVQAADDDILNGEHGDPILRYALRKGGHWSDEWVGRAFSEMPREVLLKVAEEKSNQAAYYQGDGAGKTNAENKARYARWDAAKALGWARRKEMGWQPPQMATGEAGRYSNDDDIPF